MSSTAHNADSPSMADLVMEVAEDAILWLTPEGHIDHQNASATRLFQHCAAEAPTTLFDCVREPDAADWPALGSRLCSTGAISMSTTLNCATPVPVALSLHCLRQGKQQIFCAFLRDLTWQHDQKELIEGLAKFPAENPNPVMRITVQGDIIYANDGSQPLLDVWDAAESRRLPQEWQTLLSRIYRDGHSMEQEVRAGRAVYLMLFLPIPNSEYITVYGRDITGRKHAEEQLHKALAEVNELRERLEAENVYLQDEIRNSHNFEEIITSGDVFVDVLDKVQQVAATDSTVLILGETGTGKELIARAVHSAGARKDRPLVKVNCAALPSTLIESELFGHEKGAFTGALNLKIGRFELAHEGTIFLDEIGDLPLELQAKLLRVLQEGEFERLGGSETRRVDVRIIAATNHDLADAARKGEFREDLFYRLNVFPILVPPLRLRKADIPGLAQHFVRRYAGRTGSHVDSIPGAVMERLTVYDWPGNVRELENVIERALILSRGTALQLDEHLDAATPKPDEKPGPSSLNLRDMEQGLIREAMSRTAGKIEGPHGAATLLGVAPSTLRDRIRRFDLNR